MPVAASLVALPPSPSTICRHPRDMASAMSCPTPKVVVCRGLRHSSGTSVRPAADARSTSAVVPATAYDASRGSPSGPVTLHVTIRTCIAERSASTVPSPPSAMGKTTVRHSGKTRRTPSAAASASCREVADPLKESKARIIFFITRKNTKKSPSPTGKYQISL